MIPNQKHLVSNSRVRIKAKWEPKLDSFETFTEGMSMVITDRCNCTCNYDTNELQCSVQRDNMCLIIISLPETSGYIFIYSAAPQVVA